MPNKNQIVLTGDRPTGKLHLGHYVGSLRNRLTLQEKHPIYLLVADLHALTTNTDTDNLKENVKNLVIDQLAVGIDPTKATFLIQSEVPEDMELATIFSMLISKPTVERVPTLKEMLRDLKIKNPSMGLINYPVLQAADILIVKGSLVPVGRDQASHVELSREIATRFNSLYGEILPVPEPLIPKETGTLPGIDGKAKMSKSLGNAIFLSDDEKTVNEKVMQMYTDPGHIHVNDPGKVEGNTVFNYLDIFDSRKEEVEDLKKQYRGGGLGDVVIKKRLMEVLNNFLAPIREKRKEFEKDEKAVMKILEEGTKKARAAAKETLSEVKRAMKIDYFG